ncbi:hypothetical protein [Alteromonas halophila]|uniref:Uncharacterized protein n=1 Tax=Alteromonas halophila TaxID=516698 RepID=A0A918JQ92_9ALTE|nr:hypothetical protein [Alteromonas halophila]GGW96949.1 hypothetical protein GCM10007391_33810 [Alteromonas halophila]
MKQSTLSIKMDEGKWLVDVFTKNRDDGIYELIAPNQSAEVSLDPDDMYGFRYHLTGAPRTAFCIKLDDTVLAEGEVDESGMKEGRGVI